MSPIYPSAELVLPYYGEINLAEPAVTVIPNSLGASITILTTPEGTIAVPVSVRASFTTSATVANRVLALRYVDADGNILDEFIQTQAQVATQTGAYTWSPQVTSGYGFSNISGVAPLQPIGLLAGWTVRLFVYQTQAGDFWTAGTTISFVRIPTGAQVETPPLPLSPLELPPAPAAPPAPSPGPALIGPPVKV